jgi:hypothetical protein
MSGHANIWHDRMQLHAGDPTKILDLIVVTNILSKYHTTITHT